MAQRHLHELLSEEQEPFALQRFIDERRCQLRRPSSKGSPSSQQYGPQLPIKRRTSPLLESRAFSPSVLARSPSSSFIPFRETFDCKKSPLLQLPREKSPSASRLTAAILLEAAVRIQKQEQQQQQSQKKRRRWSSTKEAESPPSRRFGLGFLASVLKRLVVRKRQRGITGEEEEGPFKSPSRGFLKWDSHYGEKAGGRTVQVAIHHQKEADFDVFDPHYGLRTDPAHRNDEEADHPQGSICCRCGIPECPRSGGARVPAVSEGVYISSPSRRPPGPSSAGGAPPELRTPEGSPDRRCTERQLLGGGTGNDGSAVSLYYEEKKEHSSPVSVLDPPFDEEEEGHHHHHYHDGGDHGHHPELEEAREGEEGEEEEDVVDVDSFQHSLAIVQRAKQELLSRIRRFERLAELDPVELERRLAEEEEEEEDVEDDEEYGGGGGPDTLGACPDGVEMQVPGMCELVRVVLQGLYGGAGSKFSGDMRRLVVDLAEEERNGNAVEKAAEGVRKRFEAWRRVESNTIDMMVGKDLRQEGDGWRRFPEQVREAAAEIEAAVFHSLLDELIADEEFVCCTD